jgi:predicted Zn-dependent protease
MSEQSPFLTVTMAQIYLRQGHLDRAERVYRALLARRPDDASLVRNLEQVRRLRLSQDSPAESAETVARGSEPRLAARASGAAERVSEAIPVVGAQAPRAANRGAEPDPEYSGIGALLRHRVR